MLDVIPALRRRGLRWDTQRLVCTLPWMDGTCGRAPRPILGRTAQVVFRNPLAASRHDPDPGEERWQTIGVMGHVVVFVVHTWPEPDPATGEEVGRIISARKATAHERRAGGHMKKEISDRLTPAQQAEIDALAALPEPGIETREMPEVLDWSGARRGLFFRPIKQQLTLRIDADVIAWFKSHAERRGLSDAHQPRLA